MSGRIHSHSPNLETIQLRSFPDTLELRFDYHLFLRVEPDPYTFLENFCIEPERQEFGIGTNYYIWKYSVPCESFRRAYKIEI